ncbi:hypothetical protein WMY93_018606 [Mugilogobius chulae]|uniref:B30.2/SPRY domain-containing protein n=1 Tax=Mugilogobius chulae TaxID=88201 RepID=A0AAW0NVE1_9GOBI
MWQCYRNTSWWRLLTNSRKSLLSTQQLMELFCRTDQHLICSVCVDQHKGHDTVSSAAERKQRQTQLEAKKSLLLQSLQNKEKDLKKLQQTAQDITCTAKKVIKESGDMFTEMILLLKERRSEIEKQIQSDQEIKLNQVQTFQDQLQKDISELKSTISQLDILSLTPDHNQFILCYPPLSTDVKVTESRVNIQDLKEDFEYMTRALSALKDKLQLTLKEFKLLEPEEITREDFIRYACDITLDQNTAQRYISLSDGNKKVTVDKNHIYTNLQGRFQNCKVMSKESLPGRCYWEVEWSVKLWVRIAVLYKDIHRQGSGFGNNDTSWALRCEKSKFSFWFNGVETRVSGPVSSRIGVYLDHSEGVLSFYSVKDQSMSLLHKVKTNFTQPLFAGFLKKLGLDSAEKPVQLEVYSGQPQGQQINLQCVFPLPAHGSIMDRTAAGMKRRKSAVQRSQRGHQGERAAHREAPVRGN